MKYFEALKLCGVEDCDINYHLLDFVKLMKIKTRHYVMHPTIRNAPLESEQRNYR